MFWPPRRLRWLRADTSFIGVRNRFPTAISRTGSSHSRSGDNGADRSTDAGFGRGGWGSIHNASAFSDRADTFNQNHPDWRQSTTQFQQNRFNEANQLQSNGS